MTTAESAYVRNLFHALNSALIEDDKKAHFHYNDEIEKAIFAYNHTLDHRVEKESAEKISGFFAKACVSGGTLPSKCFWIKKNQNDIETITTFASPVIEKGRRAVVADLSKEDVNAIATCPNIWPKISSAYAICDFMTDR